MKLLMKLLRDTNMKKDGANITMKAKASLMILIRIHLAYLLNRKSLLLMSNLASISYHTHKSTKWQSIEHFNHLKIRYPRLKSQYTHFWRTRGTRHLPTATMAFSNHQTTRRATSGTSKYPGKQQLAQMSQLWRSRSKTTRANSQ